jgi:predicted RNase H-like nuclease (RuvC/YqgF family)
MQTPTHIDTSWLVAAASLLGAIGVLLKTWLDKRKTDADADQSTAGGALAISNAAAATVTYLTKRVEELSTENEVLRAKVEKMQCEIDRLRDALDDMEQLRGAIRLLRQQLISGGKRPVVDLGDDKPA